MNKEVAVCISGRVSSDPRYIKTIHNKFSGSDFFLVFDQNESNEKIDQTIDLLKPKQYLVIKSTNNTSMANMWEKILKCFQLACSYAEKNHKDYNFLVRLRFDLILSMSQDCLDSYFSQHLSKSYNKRICIVDSVWRHRPIPKYFTDEYFIVHTYGGDYSILRSLSLFIEKIKHYNNSTWKIPELQIYRHLLRSGYTIYKLPIKVNLDAWQNDKRRQVSKHIKRVLFGEKTIMKFII